MSDLISRQAAIDVVLFGLTYVKAFDKETGEVKEPFSKGNYELMKAVDRIKEIPSIDTDAVVRCKNCEYWPYRPINWNDDRVEYQTWPWCHRIGIRGGEGYCSEGERRREEYASNS